MGTTTEVGIYNRALLKIGHTEACVATTDDTLAARTCKLVYDDCLAEVLTDYPMSFSKQHAVLVIAAGATRKGWEYVYTLPVDFLAARFLVCGESRIDLTDPDNRYPYEIMLNAAGTAKVFCCDLSATDIDALEYTALVTTVSLFPAAFVDALAWRMAVELAAAIPKDANLAKMAFQMYRAQVEMAFAQSARGNRHDQPLQGSGTRSRA
jgi:hypothetical protein